MRQARAARVGSSPVDVQCVQQTAGPFARSALSPQSGRSASSASVQSESQRLSRLKGWLRLLHLQLRSQAQENQCPLEAQ